jgi:hypothetical protein
MGEPEELIVPAVMIVLISCGTPPRSTRDVHAVSPAWEVFHA